MAKALILTDGKAGHENQSRAFARALGLVCDVREIHFRSQAAKALSYVASRLFGCYSIRLFDRTLDVAAGDYAAVIGTGSGTFYAAVAYARRLGVKCGVVLYPRGYRLKSFDCILAPQFDRPISAPQIVEIPANLVATDATFYEKGIAAFDEHYLRVNGRARATDRPAVGVVVGGPNKCSTLSPEWMRRELDRIFAENAGSLLWVTTSRRTPPEVEAVVRNYAWDYRLLYSEDHFNPIPAFVARARRLYVTAESTGMLSEACTAGSAEVRVLDNLKPGPSKFRRFVEDLKRQGYVDGSNKIDLSTRFAAARRLMGLA